MKQSNESQLGFGTVAVNWDEELVQDTRNC